MIQFEFHGEKLTMRRAGKYPNGTEAVTIEGEEGDPFAKLTVAVDHFKPKPGTFLLKGWAENEPIYEHLKEHGLIVETGETVPTGRVVAKVCRIPGLE